MCRFVFLACFFVDGQKIAWFINHPGCILKPCNNWINITIVI